MFRATIKVVETGSVHDILYISGGPKNDSTFRVDSAPLIFLINYEFHLTEFGKSNIV